MISNLPVVELVANTPAPPLPSMVPPADIFRIPVPVSSARIPLAEPVTALAVIVRFDAELCLFRANIPCLPDPAPVTCPEALIKREPDAELDALIPCPELAVTAPALTLIFPLLELIARIPSPLFA